MTWPLILSIVSLLIFLLGPVVSRTAKGPRMAGMKVSQVGVLLSVVFLLVAAVTLVRKPSWQSGVALIFSGLPVLIIAVTIAGVAMRKLPRINDVSTDVDDPPTFEHSAGLPENAGRKMNFREENRGLVRSGYPDLAPLALAGSPDEVFDKARRVAQTMPGWAIAAADPGTRTIEASEESKVYGFVDDVVVRVRPAATGSVVDVRSKSREGRGDFGANATRIRAYLARLRNPL